MKYGLNLDIYGLLRILIRCARAFCMWNRFVVHIVTLFVIKVYLQRNSVMLHCYQEGVLYS